MRRKLFRADTAACADCKEKRVCGLVGFGFRVWSLGFRVWMWLLLLLVPSFFVVLVAVAVAVVLVVMSAVEDLPQSPKR